MEDIHLESNSPSKSIKRFRGSRILTIFFTFSFLGIFSYYIFSAPLSSMSVANRQGTIIHITPNESLKTISEELEIKKVVRQAVVVKSLVTLFKFGQPIATGDYLFKDRISAFHIALMLARSEHGINPIRVTLKEGLTNDEIATVLGSKLLSFRRDLFLADPRSKQGYLFPDTYFFFPLTTSKEIIDEMSANFIKRTIVISSDMLASNRTFADIITMASLIQKEALGESDSALIAGVLWKRIKKSMPLQVDASPVTYKKVGLPDQPISNPGLIAIKAAAKPVDSPYLYYIHDKHGIVHFAVTFTEHKANINRYLR